MGRVDGGQVACPGYDAGCGEVAEQTDGGHHVGGDSDADEEFDKGVDDEVDALLYSVAFFLEGILGGHLSLVFFFFFKVSASTILMAKGSKRVGR